jgi:SAM-dependent MidA family methyltransferase
VTPEPEIPPPLAELLSRGDLSFREFVEWALYDERNGYYTAAAGSRPRHRDFITAPAISPIFAWAIARWFQSTVLASAGASAAIVDVGCGDGALLAALGDELDRLGAGEIGLVGIDRGLGFVPDERRRAARFTFSSSFEAIPSDRPVLVICNELFDAVPFARVVQREDGLSELFVTLAGDRLDWSERAAAAELVDYLETRGVELAVGQFADFTPEWGRIYGEIAARIKEGVILTLDYGYDIRHFFDNRARRFGTAAAYSGHQVHRNLLDRPGEQDLTCHVNFDDLTVEGEQGGFETVAFTRLARFLIAAGAAEHPIFSQPPQEGLEEALEQRQARENARRLLLPDGIGDEMRVLIQEKGGSFIGPGAHPDMTWRRK